MVKFITFRSLKETYEAPITMNYDDWVHYVEEGDNTLYGGAVIPGGTSMDGAVINGSPRQNFETASFPHPDSSPSFNDSDYTNYIARRIAYERRKRRQISMSSPAPS